MSCGMQVMKRTQAVYTEGSTTSEVFVPFTPVLSSAKYEKARATLLLESLTGQIKIGLAVITSDDGLSWSAPVAFGSDGYQTSEGYHYPSGLTNVLATSRYFKMGVMSLNTTGTDVEQGLATLNIDLVGR